MLQAVVRQQAQKHVERQRCQVTVVDGRLHQRDGAHGPVAAELRGVEEEPRVHRKKVVERQLSGGGGADRRGVVESTGEDGSRTGTTAAHQNELQDKKRSAFTDSRAGRKISGRTLRSREKRNTLARFNAELRHRSTEKFKFSRSTPKHKSFSRSWLLTFFVPPQKAVGDSIFSLADPTQF